MPARWRATPTRVNATAMTSSGQSMVGWIVGPPRRNTEAGWCRVFHQSTENLTIGHVDGADEGQDRDRAGGAGRLVDGAPQREDAADT